MYLLLIASMVIYTDTDVSVLTLCVFPGQLCKHRCSSADMAEKNWSHNQRHGVIEHSGIQSYIPHKKPKQVKKQRNINTTLYS